MHGRGYYPSIRHVTPYFELKNEKTLLNGFKIKPEYSNEEIIMKNDSNEKIRSDGVFTTQQAFIFNCKYNPEIDKDGGSDRELLVSEIKFTLNICITLGTVYDVLKGHDDQYKLILFDQ